MTLRSRLERGREGMRVRMDHDVPLLSFGEREGVKKVVEGPNKCSFLFGESERVAGSPNDPSISQP